MKIHLSLATTDLERSIRFYSNLLDAKPRKVLEDYALFVAEEPGVELALDLRDRVQPPADAHFGISVESVGEVERAIARLETAGLVSSVERARTCCYASQTKVWAIDPEGRRWEVYTVHEETEQRDLEQTECCADAQGQRACCAA